MPRAEQIVRLPQRVGRIPRPHQLFGCGRVPFTAVQLPTAGVKAGSAAAGARLAERAAIS
jgi:hypothetical protein